MLSSGTAHATDRERPDLSGIWQALGEAHWDIEPHLARSALQERQGPGGPVPAQALLPLGAVGSVPPGIGIVAGGRIPYTAEALARRDENRAHWLERDPEIKCFLPGVPRATYMPYPLQIVQSDQVVLISYEYAAAVREVLMEDPVPRRSTRACF